MLNAAAKHRILLSTKSRTRSATGFERDLTYDAVGSVLSSGQSYWAAEWIWCGEGEPQPARQRLKGRVLKLYKDDVEVCEVQKLWITRGALNETGGHDLTCSFIAVGGVNALRTVGRFELRDHEGGSWRLQLRRFDGFEVEGFLE